MEKTQEEIARDDGWVPQEEWKGDPDNWISAEEFNERGKNIRPILQANNARLKSQVESLNERIDQLLASNAEFKQFSDQQRALQQKRYEARIKELEAERAKAVSDGDGEAFARTEQELNQLKTQAQPQPKVAPELQQWLRDNSWYNPDSINYDPVKASLVDGFSKKLEKDRPDLKGVAHLEACVESAMNEFPERFGKVVKTPVETPTGGQKRGGGKTFDDLPQEAKDACERFERDIPGFSREDYLKNYEWEAV